VRAPALDAVAAQQGRSCSSIDFETFSKDIISSAHTGQIPLLEATMINSHAPAAKAGALLFQQVERRVQALLTEHGV
jgi:hypothetical protein